MTTWLPPSPGDVVVIPFEFLDGSGSKNRPAAVLSTREYNANWRWFIFAPITGSAGSVDGAIELVDIAEAGLRQRSYLHGIIATANNDMISRIIGRLSPRDSNRLRSFIKDTLGI